ncbi:MAG: hypothetical protein ACLSVX_02025 [Massilimicrobiota timonensis]
MLNNIKTYLKSEEAINMSVEQILFLVIAVIGVVVVGTMIFNGIKKGKEVMGEDFNMGG